MARKAGNAVGASFSAGGGGPRHTRIVSIRHNRPFAPRARPSRAGVANALNRRPEPSQTGPMDHLPISLNMRGRTVVLAGGGVSAARRAETLLKSGARVRAFAPEFIGDFEALAEAGAGRCECVARALQAEDLAGAALCIAASGDSEADARAGALARAAGVWVTIAERPDESDFALPSIIDRKPLFVAISTGGASPLLARRLRARLEAAIPSGYGRLAALVKEGRGPVRARLSDTQARRRFWEQALDGPIGERALAGDMAGARAALIEALEAFASGRAAESGEVYLVGAGPGDPDLLTFRALRLMQQAEVVLYDRLVAPEILELVRREAERVYVGKRPNNHAAPQEEISAMLVRYARAGKRVLRLNGGDPFVFGRGGEEIETLAEHGVPFQVCPGITAAIGCSAYSGIPLTHRDHAQTCVFVAGHGRDGKIARDWTGLARPGQTVAIYMGLGQIEELTADMIAQGVAADTPSAVVDNGARPNQRVVAAPLGGLAAAARAAQLRGPTIIIVGSVVTLRDKLSWTAPFAPDAPIG